MNTDGRWHHRIISKAYPVSKVSALTAALLLFAIGAFAILLRTQLRMPMNIPGRHGIMVMLLIMTGRAASTRNIAGIYSGMGASIMLLFPFIGLLLSSLTHGLSSPAGSEGRLRRRPACPKGPWHRASRPGVAVRAASFLWSGQRGGFSGPSGRRSQRSARPNWHVRWSHGTS